MNKKGVFLPLFVIITMVILAALAVVINNEKAERQDLVGIRAINIMKINDESEKINLYLDLSSEHAAKNAELTLAENGGYSENNRCEKTELENYVIWNTCQVLNPEEEFKLQFQKEFKIFINSYESSYINTDYRELFEIDKSVDEDYNKIYTDNVRNSNIISVESANNKLTSITSDIPLPLEEGEGSQIIAKPIIKTDKPETLIYGSIHNIILNNCINKELATCQSAIAQRFISASVNQEGQLIKIKIPNKDYEIKLAFNPAQLIPEYQGRISQESNAVNVIQTPQIEQQTISCQNTQDILLSNTQDQSMNFLDGLKIFIPAKATCGGEFPVIIHLHGINVLHESNVFIGEGGRGMENIIKQHIDNGGKPIIIVEPTEFKTTSRELWASEFDYNRMKDIVKNKLEERNIQIKHISVLGHSGAGCDLQNGIYKIIKTEKDLHIVGLEDICYSSAYANALLQDLPPSTFLISINNGVTAGWSSGSREFTGFENTLGLTEQNIGCSTDKYSYCKTDEDRNRVSLQATNAKHFDIPLILVSEILDPKYSLFSQQEISVVS